MPILSRYPSDLKSGKKYFKFCLVNLIIRYTIIAFTNIANCNKHSSVEVGLNFTTAYKTPEKLSAAFK